MRSLATKLCLIVALVAISPHAGVAGDQFGPPFSDADHDAGCGSVAALGTCSADADADVSGTLFASGSVSGHDAIPWYSTAYAVARIAVPYTVPAGTRRIVVHARASVDAQSSSNAMPTGYTLAGGSGVLQITSDHDCCGYGNGVFVDPMQNESATGDADLALYLDNFDEDFPAGPITFFVQAAISLQTAFGSSLSASVSATVDWVTIETVPSNAS